MKKYTCFCIIRRLLLLSVLIFSCVEEENKSSNPSGGIGVVTRSESYQCVKGSITGEKSPYVGEHYYTYTVSLSSKLNGAASVKLTSNGTAALFRDHTGNFVTTSGTVYVPKGKTSFTFDVLWVKDISNTCLFVSTDFNSVRQIEGSLCDIKVQTGTIRLNGSGSIVSGDEFELFASYDQINNNHRANWEYDSNGFLLIKEWSDNNKYYARFKATKEMPDNVESEYLDIKLNIEEVFLISNWLRVRSGKVSLMVKNPFYCEFDEIARCSGDAFYINMPNINIDSGAEINWATVGPIELMSGQGTSRALFKAIEDGKGYASVTYNVNYKGLFKTRTTSKFWVGLPVFNSRQKYYKYLEQGEGSYIPFTSVSPILPPKPLVVDIFMSLEGHKKIEYELLSGTASISLDGTTLHVYPIIRGGLTNIKIRVYVSNICGIISEDYEIDVLKKADYEGKIKAIDGETVVLNILDPGPYSWDGYLRIPWLSQNVIGQQIIYTFNYNYWLSAGSPLVYYNHFIDARNKEHTIRIDVNDKVAYEPFLDKSH